jgi:hypothetical protein
MRTSPCWATVINVASSDGKAAKKRVEGKGGPRSRAVARREVGEPEGRANVDVAVAAATPDGGRERPTQTGGRRTGRELGTKTTKRAMRLH